jgi:DNA polymerase
MCAYCLDDGEMQFWQESDDKAELVHLIESNTCVAWNKGFEERLLAAVWKVKAKAWTDAMVSARYAGLPAGLKDCNKVPFFAGQSVTTKETLLINKFCKPGKNGTVRNRETDPEDWAFFCDYCRRDVLDTRLIFNWLSTRFPFPARVFNAWLLDQKINRRGMPIDLPMCYNADAEATRLQALAVEQLAALTGLANPNSVAQLLKWVAERGYVYNSLGKELVKKAIEELPDGECKQALELRLSGTKSSVKKFKKILEQISPDNRLRDQYAYYKAHTGRWAGRGAQLQNLKAARTKEEKALVASVVAALVEGREVANLDALTLAGRPLIKAPKGKKVVLADFKSVENRVLAWVAGCEAMMQVYREGKDPYIDFASRMENIPYDEVSAEMRQIAKPGTLGCGFGLGGGKLVRVAKCKACKESWNVGLDADTSECPKCKAVVVTNQVQKTGLWRYAEMMGVVIDQKEAAKQVEEFRMSFTEVCSFWYYLEEAFYACVMTKRNQTLTSSLGAKIVLRYQDPALRITLPSGRELHYLNPTAFETRDERGFKKQTIGFEGVRGHSWGTQYTYGGRLAENIVQAIAADLLVDALLKTEEDGKLELIGHCHDEIICLADTSDKTAAERLEGYMSTCEPWAVGLLMAADSYEGERYAKG